MSGSQGRVGAGVAPGRVIARSTGASLKLKLSSSLLPSYLPTFLPILSPPPALNRLHGRHRPFSSHSPSRRSLSFPSTLAQPPPSSPSSLRFLVQMGRRITAGLPIIVSTYDIRDPDTARESRARSRPSIRADPLSLSLSLLSPHRNYLLVTESPAPATCRP